LNKRIKKPTPQDIARLIPNTFPFPNWLIDGEDGNGDGIWSLLTGEEQNLLTIVIRKTYGWWKMKDRLAVSQLVSYSGLSDGTVRKYMNRLVVFRLVIEYSESINDPRGREYGLQTDEQNVDYDALVHRSTTRDELNKRRMAKRREKITPPVAQGEYENPKKQVTLPVSQGATLPVAQDTQNHKPDIKLNIYKGSAEKRNSKKKGGDLLDSHLELERMKAAANNKPHQGWEHRHMFENDDRQAALADMTVHLFGTPMKSELYALLHSVANLIKNDVTPDDLLNAVATARKTWNVPPTGVTEGIVKLARTIAIERRENELKNSNSKNPSAQGTGKSAVQVGALASRINDRRSGQQ